MSYIKPSILVYQDLQNAGGVLNSTPDLETCIIGPAYNIVSYTPGSILSQLTTAAISAVATTGDIVAGSNSLSVTSTGGFNTGDVIMIPGAGLSGTNLQASISSIVGNVITISTPASVTVTGVSVTQVGEISGGLGDTFKISSVKPGQIVDPDSVQVWLDDVRVETVTDAIASKVTNNEYSLQVTDSNAVTNLNSTTYTLKVEAGDEIIVSYLDSGSDPHTFSSIVRSLTTTSGQNGDLDYVTFIDKLPTNLTVGGTDITVSFVKTLNDLLIPYAKVSAPLTHNYNTDNVGIDGSITLSSDISVVYGVVLSGKVYFAYNALRTDLSGTVLTINDMADLEGQLGTISDLNPLALGCELALSNTVTRVRAVAVSSDDYLGYVEAFTVSEGERLYSIVPLTQDMTTISALASHVKQMRTPANAAWRVGVVNTKIPTTKDVGSASVGAPNNDVSNAITLVSGSYVLSSDVATFISDGVVPGDMVHIVAGTSQVGTHQVTTVLGNQSIVISATAAATGVSFYITRNLTKTQQAEEVAAVSTTLGANSVWHIQSDVVGVEVNGVTKYLPGYYLACAHAGAVAGFPVQQGFTNIGVAGISDLKNSNFYFSKADLNHMAEAGTCLYVQDSQGGIPYCRHALTTDVTVLEYREQLIVKNWDFLSYFYYDKLKGFIGSWNITPDTMNIIRQTINASSELLKQQSLPKIGPPLLDAKIVSLAQSAVNKDNLDVVLSISIVSPLNYLNLHLVI
jgi:hypothetical protein